VPSGSKHSTETCLKLVQQFGLSRLMCILHVLSESLLGTIERRGTVHEANETLSYVGTNWFVCPNVTRNRWHHATGSSTDVNTDKWNDDESFRRTWGQLANRDPRLDATAEYSSLPAFLARDHGMGGKEKNYVQSI
jgi:hypothetical protein